MTMKTEREITREITKAEDFYLELRDAKSNGCLHGKPLSEVLSYDRQIEQAYNKVEKLREERKVLFGW